MPSLMPSPGIWKLVDRIAFWTFAESLVFTVLGKGKWRILIPVWAVAYAFVVYMIAMFELRLCSARIQYNRSISLASGPTCNCSGDRHFCGQSD